MDKETLFDAFSRYDDDRLAHYVAVYCWENDVEVDTYAWDCLMRELYDNFVPKDEISFKRFDLTMCKYLV